MNNSTLIEGGNFFDDIVGTIGNTINTAANTVGNVAGVAGHVVQNLAPLAPLLLAAGAHIKRIEHHMGLAPITKEERKHMDTHRNTKDHSYFHSLTEAGKHHNVRNRHSMNKTDIKYLILLIHRMKRILSHFE